MASENKTSFSNAGVRRLIVAVLILLCTLLAVANKWITAEVYESVVNMVCILFIGGNTLEKLQMPNISNITASILTKKTTEKSPPSDKEDKVGE